jgi:hypothetical protein
MNTMVEGFREDLLSSSELIVQIEATREAKLEMVELSDHLETSSKA